MADPQLRPSKTPRIRCFCCSFEAGLKIAAQGFIKSPLDDGHAYMHSGWDVLDFLIVIEDGIEIVIVILDLVLLCEKVTKWKPNALDGPSTTLERSPVSIATVPMISSSRTASASEVLKSARSSPRMMTETATEIGISPHPR